MKRLVLLSIALGLLVAPASRAELELDTEEASQVEGWLKIPPRPEDIDPNDIPESHRQVFLNTMLQVVGADGHVDAREMENLSLLEQLLR